MRALMLAAGLILACVAGSVPLVGQAGGGTVQLTVQETAGIRRTEYPVSTRVTLAKGALKDVTHVRLRSGDTELAGQYTSAATWDDGSIRDLDVDFNLSIGASESRAVRIDYGADVTADAKPRGGLMVTDGADVIQVGNVSFGRRGWPLLKSVSYRGEIIGPGANGLVLIDAAGARHDFGSAGPVTVDVVKPGPLLVAIRFSTRVPLDGGVDVPVMMTCEMPNSKSWVRIHIAIDDSGRRVRGLFIETPFALASFPWTWDFGTDTGTYGAFRAVTDTAVLTQTVASSGNAWRVETGTAAAHSVYEQSTPNRARTVAGWGHLLDARNVIAFAVDAFASAPGTYSMSLNGEGHASLGYVRSGATARHELTIYQHYVSTPMPIGAATSPAAMVRPLSIKVDR